MSEQANAAFDHGEGLGDNDGAPPKRSGPMPLLTVVAFQGDGLALALVVAAIRQHQWVDDQGSRMRPIRSSFQAKIAPARLGID